MKRPQQKKRTGIVKIAFVLLMLFGTMYAPAATRLTDYLQAHNDARLITLTTALNPAIYLSGNTVANITDPNPTVVHTDVESFPMLYAAKDEFSSVEMVMVRLTKPEDETAALDVLKMTSFTNLKYVFFKYQYKVCDDMTTDACIAEKMNGKIINRTDKPVIELYKLEVPI